MPRELVVGVGQAAAVGADLLLDLGPHHPSAHGALQLALTLEDDVVVRAAPRLGFLHRGAEKLFEARDYRQVVALADRHDWLSGAANELGVVLAVERLMGLEVPPRAVWLRMLYAELTRVLHALHFLPALLPDPPLHETLHRARELLQAALEEATGARVHPAVNRVGGLAEDVPRGWPDRLVRAADQVRPVLEAARARLDAAPGGTGVLDRALCAPHGVTGPVARASGHDVDLRRDEPYLAYGELDVPVAVEQDGDSRARALVLARSALGALDLLAACRDRLPDGPVSVRLPPTLRPPEGSVYARTEAPSGVSGWYLVSRGGKAPYRLAMRTASFANLSVLPALLPGTALADLPAVLGTLFFVVGDVDR